MKTISLLTALCLAVGVPAQAESLFKPIELKDQELAQLRGRYVLPGRIVSFGIIMSSTWKNSAGESIGAKVQMQMQQTTIKPQFYVTTYDSAGDGSTPTAGTGSVSGGAGLNQTSGVTQSVRSAGDYNTAYNNVSIDISRDGKATASSDPGQPLGDAISRSNGAGTITVSPSGGGVQLAIQANGQGSSVQKLATGGLFQATNLIGAGNQVNNLTQLGVVLRDNAPASAAAMDQNIAQLRGLRAMGM